MKVTSNIRLDIQAMRGIAVLAVVLFHANENVFPLGYLGVDIFFVISGFVVTPSIVRVIQRDLSARNIFSNLLRFYKRRFFRLAPALGFALLLSSILVFAFGNMQDHLRVARQGIATFLIVGNLGAVRYSGNYFSPNPNPFIHTWSLSVEEQIYILLPLLLIFLSYTFGFARKKLIIFLTLISSCSLLIFLQPQILEMLNSAIGLTNHFDAAFYSPYSRVWEFGLGGLAALIRSKEIASALYDNAFIRPVLIVFILLVFVPKIDLDFLISCIAITVLSTLAIYMRAFDMFPRKIVGPLVWLGDRSYSIYLFHMPLIYIAKYSPIKLIDENYLISIILALLFTLLLGNFSYALVENKFRLNQNSETKRRNSFLTALIISSFLPLSLLISIDYEVRNNYSNILPKQNSYETSDTHQAFTRGCIDFKFDQEKCIWPVDESIGEILVVGDSQAYALADGVIRAGNKLRYDVVVSSISGCPFMGLDTTGAKSVNCLNWQNEILNYIQDRKPKLVFIANRTNGYLNPDSGWRVLIEPNGAEIRERNAAIEMYKGALNKILRKVTESSNAVLIQNIPEPKLIDSNTIFSKLFDRKANRYISIDRFSTDHAVIKIEQKIAKAIPRAYVLNSTITLCPLDNCILREAGRDIYRDSWHLSTFGSLKLENQIKNILTSFISSKHQSYLN